MKILAIDTSCDDSCAAILDTETWQLLSDIVQTHLVPMEPFGGVVPEIASREHLKALPGVVVEALRQAHLEAKDIGWVAVSSRPGLIGSLLVGVSFAKAFAYSLGIPFTAMNHIDSHLFSPFLCLTQKKSPPPFPWLSLVVSGGHTELFFVKSVTDFSRMGGTLDDAAGEAFDKIGKLLGLPYPAGPQIDNWVREKATEFHRSIRFPIAKTDSFDFSFSGLKTAVSIEIKNRQNLGDESKIAIAASAQEAILNALIGKMKAAQREYPEASLVVTGGVACNSRFREKLPEAYFPEKRFCTDNASMVAVLAGLLGREKILTPSPWTEGAFPQYNNPDESKRHTLS